MKTHIPVLVKLRPWRIRLRNHYRNYRHLDLKPLPAAIEAFMTSLIGTRFDFLRRGRWSK